MIMEVFGIPPMEVLRRAKRKDKFFLGDTNPIRVYNKHGKCRIPGSKSLEGIVKTEDPHFMDFIKVFFKIVVLLNNGFI